MQVAGLALDQDMQQLQGLAVEGLVPVCHLPAWHFVNFLIPPASSSDCLVPCGEQFPLILCATQLKRK